MVDKCMPTKREDDLYLLRPCQAADLPDVSRLSVEWAAENLTHGYAPTPPDDLRNRLGSYFWVAEHGSQIIAFAFGSAHVSPGLAVIPAGEAYLEIDEIYVHPEHRGGDIGSRLAHELLAEAESQGITRTLVYSASKDWRRIVGFYQRLGFEMWFVQMVR